MFARAVFLKLDCAQESPGELIKMQTEFYRSVGSSESLHFYSLPGDTDAAVSHTQDLPTDHLVGSVSDLRIELLSAHYVSWRVFSELH